jgi:uncharacterized membrane protein YfcA
MIIYAIISIGGSVICSILQEYIIIEKQIFSFIFGVVELLIVIQLIFQTRSQIRRNSLQNQLSTNGEDLKKPQQSSLSQISSDKNESSTQISPNSNNKLSSKLNSLQEKDNQISREMLIGCYSRHDRNKFLPFLFVISGFFSTFLGIGGGIINMPILYGLMGIPIHYASAASTSILFITSIYNVTYYGLLGAINWEIALIMGIGMVLGSYIAAVYAKRVPKMVMITILLGILIYSGIRLLLQTFGI